MQLTVRTVKGTGLMYGYQLDLATAESRLNAALDKLQRFAADNLPVESRRRAERAYADAYDDLVRLGARRKLRPKYRVR